MGAWDTILKYGGKAMKGMGKAANATGKSAGHAVLHPSQTLRGAGQAVKTATAGAAVGYVGWEKLTTDKSVARIVSEAVVGKSATDALAGTTEDMKELKDKAGETVSAIGEAVGGADSKLNGGIELPAGSLRRWVVQHAQRLFAKPRRGQCVGIEHCRTYRSSVPRVRTFRLAG